jgi:N-acetyl-anhydromuramyl-L-alanine amidase AmpD
MNKTLHVNDYTTLRGVKNDNSIGIEIVRSGKQKYTQLQLAALCKLVVQLQDKFGLSDQAVLSHAEIQPSDRSDPVDFDWNGFRQQVISLRDSGRVTAEAAKTSPPRGARKRS